MRREGGAGTTRIGVPNLAYGSHTATSVVTIRR